MTDRKSYYIKPESDPKETLMRALEWLSEACKRSNSQKAFLAANSMGVLDGIIKDALGKDAVNLLKRGGNVTLDGSIKITLITDRKSIFSASNSPILAVYASRDFIDKIDGIENVSEILLLPWTLDEIQPWIRTWKASALGETPNTSTEPLIENKVVEEALKTLTNLINKSTGIKHPTDRGRTIELFEILKAGNEEFSPEEVKSWLVANGGLKAEDANEISDVAKKVLEGRSLRRSKNYWKESIIDTWRSESKDI